MQITKRAEEAAVLLTEYYEWQSRTGQFLESPREDDHPFKDALQETIALEVTGLERTNGRIGIPKVITRDLMAQVFYNGRAIARKDVVTILVSRGFDLAASYRATEVDGKFASQLFEADGLLGWRAK